MIKSSKNIKLSPSEPYNLQSSKNSKVSKNFLLFPDLDTNYQNQNTFQINRLVTSTDDDNINKLVKFKTTLINKSKQKNNSQSKCLLEKNCPYYKKYVKLKNELDKILFQDKNLNTFNKSLLSSLEKKNKSYQILLDKYNNFRKILEQYNLYPKHENEKISLNKNIQYTVDDSIPSAKSKFNSSDKKIILNQNVRKNIRKDKRHKYTNSNNSFTKSKEEESSSDLELYSKKKGMLSVKYKSNTKRSNRSSVKSSKKNIPNKINNNGLITPNNNFKKIELYPSLRLLNQNPDNYYESINKFSNQQKHRASFLNYKYSLLSFKIDLSTVLTKKNSVTELESLTKNDDNFLEAFSDSTSDKKQLLTYCDLISQLLVDYKELIKLGCRMKDFIKSSVILVDSIIDGNSSKTFIDNTCNVLQCDRASLFILDKTSDCLIAYSGEGIKRAQIKVPKDKGIVGACFMEKIKIRIDDAYLDKRFNKTVDLKTNYRTRSILCYPLIDKDGACFGVIEAINKFNMPFNNDDEELLQCLSHQASTIFKSLVFHDNNKYLIKKLYSIIEYSIKIWNIKNKTEFTEKTEDYLLGLFNCMNAVFYFVENEKIFRYSKEEGVKKYSMGVGIVGRVVKNMEMIAYKNVRNSVDFNKIIDIEVSDGILTFPILGQKNKRVYGVAQVPYSGEINEYGKPKENEIEMIKKFSKCIKNWIKVNEKKEEYK